MESTEEEEHRHDSESLPPPPKKFWVTLAERSAVDILILSFTFVVSFTILATGATISIIEIRDPEVDTSAVARALLQIIIAILGSLFGLLAGRSEAQRKPKE